MNKLLLLHELLNMVNKDKWAEIYNTCLLYTSDAADE